MGFEVDFKAAMDDLQKIAEKLQRRVMRRALTKAARIVANNLKQRVAKDTGTLQESITFKVKNRKGVFKAIIGASSKENASRYFHLSESEGLKGKSKKESSKRVAAKIQASLDSTKGRAEGAIISEIQAGLEKAK
jgi:hypothetical protein